MIHELLFNVEVQINSAEVPRALAARLLGYDQWKELLVEGSGK